MSSILSVILNCIVCNPLFIFCYLILCFVILFYLFVLSPLSYFIFFYLLVSLFYLLLSSFISVIFFYLLLSPCIYFLSPFISFYLLVSLFISFYPLLSYHIWTFNSFYLLYLFLYRRKTYIGMMHGYGAENYKNVASVHLRETVEILPTLTAVCFGKRRLIAKQQWPDFFRRKYQRCFFPSVCLYLLSVLSFLIYHIFCMVQGLIHL